MIRPLTIVTFLLACGSGLYLYQAKHDAQVLDRTIEKTVRETALYREQSRMLMAEWTMLNDPDSLRRFSDAYLSLKTIAPSQFSSLADLDSRLPPVAVPEPVHPVQEDPSLQIAETPPAGSPPAIPPPVVAEDGKIPPPVVAEDGKIPPPVMAEDANRTPSRSNSGPIVLAAARPSARKIAASHPPATDTAAKPASTDAAYQPGSADAAYQPTRAEQPDEQNQAASASSPGNGYKPSPADAVRSSKSPTATDLRVPDQRAGDRSSVDRRSPRPPEPSAGETRLADSHPQVALAQPRPTVVASAARPLGTTRPIQAAAAATSTTTTGSSPMPARAPYVGSLLGAARSPVGLPLPRPTQVNATPQYNFN